MSDHTLGMLILVSVWAVLYIQLCVHVLGPLMRAAERHRKRVLEKVAAGYSKET